MKKEDEMPKINGRIRQLIDLYANSSVRKFADMIGISQQSLNRLFNIDPKSLKFPLPSTQILCAITKNFVDVDVRWLLIGEDTIKTKQNTASSSALLEIIKEKDSRIEQFIRENERLAMRVKQLEKDSANAISTSSKVGQSKGA